MKKWKVTIKAEDEASALVYLDMLRSNFKAAVLMGETMNECCVIDDPAKGEKTVCTLHSDSTAWDNWKVNKSAPWFVQWFERFKLFKHD